MRFFHKSITCFLSTISILGIFALAVSCSSSTNNDIDSVTTKKHLPPITYDIVDCERPTTPLSFPEWVQLGDGLIYGTVESVEPYEGTTFGVAERQYIPDVKQCESTEGGLRIHLKNVQGYLFDADVPDAMDIYAGTVLGERFGEFAPTVENGKLEWPQDIPHIFQKGMIIGGPVFYHKTLDKWTFFYGPLMPMFEVVQGSVQFQNYKSQDEGCELLPPIDDFGGKPLEYLESELQSLSADKEVYLPSTERRWSIGGDGNAELRQAYNWIGSCYTQAYKDLEKQESNRECHTVGDCPNSSIDCVDFRCVTASDACASDDDCIGGKCLKGTCVMD